MKSLQQVIVENSTGASFKETINSIVNGAIEQSNFKGTPHIRIAGGEFATVSFTFAKDTSEVSNRIWQNDNLNLVASVEIDKRSGEIIFEWSRKSATGKPLDQYHVYGTYKFKLTKIKAVNEKDATAKLAKALSKVKEEVKRLFADGVFDVHNKDFEKENNFKAIQRFVE